MQTAIEVREVLRKRDLEAACALNMPWAEELVLAEVDRVQNAREWQSCFDAVRIALESSQTLGSMPPYRGRP